MSTRIALIIPTMDQGGAEKQLCLLAQRLPRDRFDVHVVLLTRDGPRSQSLREAGIPVTVIGKRFKADPSALLRLRRHLIDLRPDVVHTWLFAANSFGRAAARWAKVPRILASERCVDPWKTDAHFFIDRRLAKCTEAITTNSAGVREFYGRHGIDPDLFRVIPNGIEPRDCEPITREEAFARLEVDVHRKLIVAVGRLWDQKRYRDLIWAAELLGALREDTTLVIVGDGPQRGELLRHRDAVTTSQRVRFAGSRGDVAQWLPHADLFWMASEYEGQSNALIEAMQAKVPAVVSDIPGNTDLVLHGQTGRLFPLGDTAEIARQSQILLQDEDAAKRVANAAAERIAREFTVEKMIQSHVELYENGHVSSPK